MLHFQIKRPEVVLAPSNVIDGIWHAHILHTKLYADFCSRLQGSFIHHEPGAGGVKAYEATLTEYFQCFQDLPPRFAWPPPSSDGQEGLKKGDRVELHSLEKAEHNGKRGELVEYDAVAGRWGVYLITKERLSVRPANLAVISRGAMAGRR